MSRLVTRSQRDWLEGEIAIWQSMGLIDEDRSKALTGLYESRESFEARQKTRGLFTLLALAAFLVGLGVLLLVGYNWEQMPAPLKITAIFGALIATHATGFSLRYRLGWRALSEVAFFMGCLFFGAAIWLLAQIFHIESSNYDALWWWAIGVLPFALFLDEILLHLLFAGLLALWIGFEVLSLDRLIWGVPSAGYSLPLLIAPGLWWAYRKSSATTIGIYVPLLAWWVVLQPIAWKMQANPTFFIGAIGSLMLLVAALHPPRSELAIPYRFYGVVLVGATLIPLSFYQFHKEVIFNSGTMWVGGLEQMILILILAGATPIAAFFVQQKSYSDLKQAHDSLARSIRQIVIRQSPPLSLLALFALLALLETTVSEPLVSTIAANIAMVVVAFGLIRFGLTADRNRPFAAGVAYLLSSDIRHRVILCSGRNGSRLRERCAEPSALCGSRARQPRHCYSQAPCHRVSYIGITRRRPADDAVDFYRSRHPPRRSPPSRWEACGWFRCFARAVTSRTGAVPP